MAGNVFEVIAELVDKVSPGLEKMGANFEGLQGTAGKAALAMGAVMASVGAVIVAQITHVMELADELSDMSKQTGISASELSKYKFALEQSGATLNDLLVAQKKFSSILTDTAEKSSDAAIALKSMHIEIKDGEGKLRPWQEIMMDVADQFAGMTDGAQKAALAVQLFGKAGINLIPFLNEGSAGIAKLKAEAEKLGIVINDETAASIDQFNDNIAAVKASSTGLAIQLVNDMAPALRRITDAMRDAAVEGGVLKALLVGFGGVLYEGFKPDPIKLLQAQIADAEKDLKFFQDRMKKTEHSTSYSYYNLNADAADRQIKVIQDLTKQLDDLKNADKAAAEAAAKEREERDAQSRKREEARQTLEKMVRAQEAETEARKKFIASLKEESETQGMSTYQKKLYEAEKLAGLITSEKERLAFLQSAEAQARKIDMYEREQVAIKDNQAGLDELIQRLQREDDANTKLRESVIKRIAQQEFENSLVGKSNEERTKAITLHELEKTGIDGLTDSQRELTAATNDELAAKAANADATDKSIKSTQKATEENKKRITSILDATSKARDDNFEKDKALLEAARDGLVEGVTVTEGQYTEALHKLTEEHAKAAGEQTEFWRQAARSMQSAMSDLFFGVMQGDLSNLGTNFKKTIDKMVADALAAKLAQALFGNSMDGGSNSGWAGAAMSYVGGLFGGAKAGGGDILAGQPTLVGELRPEVFIPKTDGRVIANTSGVGGQTVNHYSIQAIDSQSFRQALQKEARFLTDTVSKTGRQYNMGATS